MNVYRLSQDALVTTVTMLTIALLGGLAVVMGWKSFATDMSGWARLLLLGLAVLFGGIVAIGYAYSARGYSLSERAIIVQRPAGNVVLPLGEITDIRADPKPFVGAIRTAGNGGLFGFWGKFHSKRLGGSFTAYASRRDRGVVVRLKQKTVVLTPDDPDKLVADVRKRLGQEDRR